jgi:hypothetical protein
VPPEQEDTANRKRSKNEDGVREKKKADRQETTTEYLTDAEREQPHGRKMGTTGASQTSIFCHQENRVIFWKASRMHN